MNIYKKAIVDRWLINQAHSERAAEAIDFASKKLEHYDKLIDLRNKKLENTANTEINENNKNTSTHALTKQSIPQSRSFLYEASSTLYEKATSFVYISASSLLTTGQNLVQSCKDFGNSALKKLSNFI